MDDLSNAELYAAVRGVQTAMRALMTVLHEHLPHTSETVHASVLGIINDPQVLAAYGEQANVFRNMAAQAVGAVLE